MVFSLGFHLDNFRSVVGLGICIVRDGVRRGRDGREYLLGQVRNGGIGVKVGFNKANVVMLGKMDRGGLKFGDLDVVWSSGVDFDDSVRK